MGYIDQAIEVARQSGPTTRGRHSGTARRGLKRPKRDSPRPPTHETEKPNASYGPSCSMVRETFGQRPGSH